MVVDRTDEDMIYGLTINEREALQQGLRELPDTMPPRDVWRRIREQAQAEGLIKRRRLPGLSNLNVGAGIAAGVALAAAIILAQLERPISDFGTEPNSPELSNGIELTALKALMVQSQQLENDLRLLPDEPRVMRASTVATISDIEDRIAAIDFQLNETALQMTPDEQQIFWRERVRLMQSLVRLRYAQVQRTAF